MAHRYGQPITVRCDKRTGQPRAFRWHGCRYPVAEVFSTWHLMDRWWARPLPGATVSMHDHAQDRTYYRVCCRGPAGEQVFDLYHDAVTSYWMLDVAHD